MSWVMNNCLIWPSQAKGLEKKRCPYCCSHVQSLNWSAKEKAAPEKRVRPSSNALNLGDFEKLSSVFSDTFLPPGVGRGVGGSRQQHATAQWSRPVEPPARHCVSTNTATAKSQECISSYASSPHLVAGGKGRPRKEFAAVQQRRHLLLRR